MQGRNVSQKRKQRTQNRYHEHGCRCVCCDEQAAPWWLGIVAVLVAMVFMAMAGWLNEW